MLLKPTAYGGFLMLILLSKIEGNYTLNATNLHQNAVKNYLKLSNYFDLDLLSIKVPPKGFNDLGDAHQSDEDLKRWSKQEVDFKKQRQFIFDFVSKNENKFSKSYIKKAKKINE